MENKILKEALTFDDVLLIPQYSQIIPSQVSLKTQLSRNIILNTPFISAAMDKVTEAPLAAALALEGGIGIIHKNMTIESQAEQIKKVKTQIIDFKKFPLAVFDTKNRLLVGAALGVTNNALERAEALVNAGVDLLSIDSAHGHSQNVLNLIEVLRKKYPLTTLVGGNVVTIQGTEALINKGADVVKVGIGPGSICTTRIVAGVGMPQLSAIIECSEAARKLGKSVIADGGIRYSGDIVKALAAGAQAVMLGKLFAATTEAPGEVICQDNKKFKCYRGMGSLGAMQAGSSDRYFQEKISKFVPEGVEGLIPYVGSLKELVYQLVGGIKSGFGYCGSLCIEELQKKAQFVKITSASLTENHPHDLSSFQKTLNYS